MAKYKNMSGLAVEVVIGTRPGAPPDVYAAAPGETIDGPAGYPEIFKRFLLILVTDEVPVEAVAPVEQQEESVADEEPKRKKKWR